ncbi:MAG: sensor domain-containing protein [Propionibacteriaceae bacterium]
MFAWSIAGFTILVTGAAVTGSLLFLVVGVFVWIGFVHVLRWTTSVDRKLASWQRHERVPAAYRRPAARGFMAYLKTLPLDPQTWKDMAWLGVNSILGFAGRLAVTTVGGLAASYVSMPLWTGRSRIPRGITESPHLDFYTVETLGEAGITAAIGLLLIPGVLLLARWWSATHVAPAVRMLAASDVQ